MNVDINNENRPPCPNCGGNPTAVLCMYGNAHYAICSKCGWFGDGIYIEASIDDALEMWYRDAYIWNQKVENMKKPRQKYGM